MFHKLAYRLCPGRVACHGCADCDEEYGSCCEGDNGSPKRAEQPMLRFLPAEMAQERIGKRPVYQCLCKQDGRELNHVKRCDSDTYGQCDGQERGGKFVSICH